MMKQAIGLLAIAASCGAMLTYLGAQAPEDKGGRPAKQKGKDAGDSQIVKRMMAFDKNKDGKLTKDEVTDKRLLRLFEQADKNNDGVVTREELVALAAKLEADDGEGGRGGRGGPGGPGGRGGRGPGGPGGPGMRGPGGPQPGQILPGFLQEELKLTSAQKKQLESLQKEVDGKLGKILTAEQKEQLKEMGNRRGGPGGPGGPGERGGRGGRGGPGGPGGRPGPGGDRPGE